MKEAVDVLLQKINSTEKQRDFEIEHLQYRIDGVNEKALKEISAFKTAIRAICKHEHGTVNDVEYYGTHGRDQEIIQVCVACGAKV